MFLVQSALNAGRRSRPSRATLSHPIVSILWGVLAFHEKVRGGSLNLMFAALSTVLLAAAVVALARSPLLAGDQQKGRAVAGSPAADRAGGERPRESPHHHHVQPARERQGHGRHLRRRPRLEPVDRVRDWRLPGPLLTRSAAGLRFPRDRRFSRCRAALACCHPAARAHARRPAGVTLYGTIAARFGGRAADHANSGRTAGHG